MPAHAGVCRTQICDRSRRLRIQDGSGPEPQQAVPIPAGAWTTAGALDAATVPDAALTAAPLASMTAATPTLILAKSRGRLGLVFLSRALIGLSELVSGAGIGLS